MRSFVTAGMIANRLCSPSRDGQELLPQLIEKLIIASLPRKAIQNIRFPHGDEIYLHGSDGILAVTETSNHTLIPSGLSLWEMGTTVDPKSKADDDFSTAEKKLVNAFANVVPAITPDKATYVFVTSKPWESGEWIRQKRASSKWKSIKVIDAVALEKWIEECPAVMLWFADVNGLPAEGLYDAEQYLRKIGIDFGVPSITPELVIAGRDGDMQCVCDRILKCTTEIRVRGESVEEVASFVAASSLINSNAFAGKAPVVFADAQANLNLLATFGVEMTLIPLDSEALAGAKKVGGKNWRLILPEVASSATLTKPGEDDLELNRCKRAAVEQQLIEKLGFTDHKARQIVRDTKGSLIALLWLIGSGPIGLPRWACRKDATTHASLMLAGSWIGANENDTKIIERLSRKGYRDIETLLQSAEIPEGPWIHRGVEWLCASRDFVWGQLVGKVTETMLGDYLAIVNDVVGEKDPSLELPVSERYMASILGKSRKYSRALRAGLVDSVARLALLKADGQSWADRIVRELLDSEHPDALTRWLSLADVYSELAEAAPDVFLECLDDMLRSGFGRQLFQDANGDNAMFGPTSAHVFLLWALERLAWQKQYLPHVLSALTRLADVDPGGNMGNRPKNSLVTILLPWKPQHAESVENAAQIMKTLYSVSSTVTWDLGVALLPKSYGMTSGTPLPTYRESPNKQNVTVAEYWTFVRLVVEMLIEWAGNAVVRWTALVEAYPEIRRGFPEAAQSISDALAAVDPSKFSEIDKAEIYAALRKIITHHRDFQDAEWSLNKPDLLVLEALQERFAPHDLVLLSAPLFDWDPDVPEAPVKKYDEGWEEWLAKRQISAAKDVYDQGGMEDMYRLTEKATLPGRVGEALATLPLTDNEVLVLLQRGLQAAPIDSVKLPLGMMTRSFIWKKYKDEGGNWLTSILRLNLPWSDEAYANLALSVPPSVTLWGQVEQWSPAAARLYWQNVDIRFGVGENWRTVLAKWKQVVRPWSSLELMAHLVDARQKTNIAPKPTAIDLLEILEQCLQDGRETEKLRQRSGMLSYYVEIIFSYIDAQEVDMDRVAKAEWGWLRIIEGTKRGARVLQSQITSSAELFVELVKAVFRAEDEPRDKVITEEMRKAAEQAFHVLRSIRTLPGSRLTDSGVVIDQSKLRDWTLQSRKLAENAKRLDVCDSQIGQILSYAPPAPDGSWPCIEVRDVVEEIRSTTLERGLQIGRYNQRGVVTRGTGGKEEWELARNYHTHADQMRTRWPRTAAILDSLAKGYEKEAQQWDEQARRDEFD